MRGISPAALWHGHRISAALKKVRRQALVGLIIVTIGLVGIITFGSSHLAEASVCEALATGTWTSPATWTGCSGVGGLPDPLDTVIIHAGVTVTLNTSATIAGISFESSTSSAVLSFDSSNPTLTINGTVNVGQPTSSVTNAWNINGGTATVSGLITFAGATNNASFIATIVTTTGSLNANGGVTFVASNSASKVINMSGGAGVLNMKGTLTVPANSATFTMGTTSTFNYADTVAQTVNFPSGGAYSHLAFNNTAVTGATLSAAITAANVTGNLSVQSGLFRNGGFAIASNAGATFGVSNGAEFQMSATAAFPTGFGTYSFQPTSTESYLQTAATVISPQNYGNLNAKPAATSITFTMAVGSVHAQGNLVVGNGTNLADTVTANTNSTTLDVDGNVTISANTTLVASATNPFTVGGSWSDSGSFTHSSGTVTFDATTSGKIIDSASKNFNKCVFNGVGGVWATTSSFVCVGTLTLTAGELDPGGITMTITGATLIDNGATLKFNASGQTRTFNGLITINSGGSWIGLLTQSVVINAGITNNGTFNHNGSIAFNASQTIAGSSPITINASATITGAINVINSNTGGLIIGSGGVIGTVAGSTLTNAASALLKIGGSFLSTGILNASAVSNTVVYTSTNTFKVPSSSYYNLSLDGANTVSMNAPFAIANNLALTNSAKFVDAGFQATGPGISTGTFSLAAGTSYCLGTVTATCSNSVTTATTLPVFQTYAFDSTSTVAYAANADQTISSSPIYGNLTFTARPTLSRIYTFASGPLTVSGNFSVVTLTGAGSITLKMGGDITVADGKTLSLTGATASTLVTRPVSTDYNITTGNLTNTGRILDASNSASVITVKGNYANTGTFIAGHSLVVLSGSTTQTLSTFMTTTSAFYDLLIANSSGASPSDCERTGFTPSVIFAAAATVTHNYTITVPSARVQYLSGASYTFTNVSWNGQSAGAPVVFRNSATSGSWLLVVSGTIAASNLNVSRSDASGGALITTSGVGVTNCSNTNWNLAAPNIPTSLTQADSNGSLASGAWTKVADLNFAGQASDNDSVDTLSFCVEAVPLGQAFANTDTICTTPVAYSGSPLSPSVAATLTANLQYHWQARVKDRGGLVSAWVSFGGSDEAVVDFGIDQSAPTGPTSLAATRPTATWSSANQLTVNWPAAFDSGSGLAGYSDVFDTAAATVPATSQNLGAVTTVQSSVLADGNSHYFHIRAVDAVGNWGTTVTVGPFYIDSTTPTPPSQPTTTSPTTTNEPTWTWTTASDTDSGLATSRMLEWSQQADFSDSRSTSISSTETSFTHATPLTIGTWYFRVTVADQAGNSATSSSGSVVIATAPAASSPVTGPPATKTNPKVKTPAASLPPATLKPAPPTTPKTTPAGKALTSLESPTGRLNLVLIVSLITLFVIFLGAILVRRRLHLS